MTISKVTANQQEFNERLTDLNQAAKAILAALDQCSVGEVRGLQARTPGRVSATLDGIARNVEQAQKLCRVTL